VPCATLEVRVELAPRTPNDVLTQQEGFGLESGVAMLAYRAVLLRVTPRGPTGWRATRRTWQLGVLVSR